MNTFRRFLVPSALVTVLQACSQPKEEALLSWSDPQLGLTFQATVSPTLAKTNSRLDVISSTKTRSETIDDDVTWGTIAFLKYKGWLLVLNDNYALAGYEEQNGLLYGEGDWGKLPFTVYKSGGVVVASKRIGTTAGLPANFPMVEQK